MDITKDLRRVMANDSSPNQIIDEIHKQQNELRLKAHLFKVLSLHKAIEETINDNTFKNTGIEFIHLEFLYDIDKDEHKGFTVNYSLHDINNNIIPRFKVSQTNGLFRKAFFEIKNVDINLTNSEELEKYHMFEVKPGLGDKLIDLFLNKELKTILEYNKMQISLENNNGNKAGKPKL